MAYNMLAFNDPRMWGVGQDYHFGEALYQNWQRQLNEIMGFEDQIQKWNVQRDKDQLAQMADQSDLAATLGENNARITGVGDAYTERARLLAKAQRRADEEKARRNRELLGLEGPMGFEEPMGVLSGMGYVSRGPSMLGGY